MISTTAVSFGSYDVFSGTARDANGTVQIDCTPREYLFRNAARTQIWGDGSAGKSIFSGNNIRNQTLTVYGCAPAAQDAVVGAYADNIVATVIF